MEYKLSEIEFVKAIVISGFKADIQVQITIKLKEAIDAENIQVKLVSNLKGFNQIDKRWIDKYIEMWEIPSNISTLLKEYTGEILPKNVNPKDKRRTFANEFSKKNQNLLLNWLNENKSLIVSDILKGRGKFSAEWMLVAQKIDDSARWVLKPMNYCLNFFGNGQIEITKRGNFKIGKITMQRKGGDGGRKTSQMLQFKINPAELFN
nr:hypothetical protein [Tenacibaculum piscium]